MCQPIVIDHRIAVNRRQPLVIGLQAECGDIWPRHNLLLNRREPAPNRTTSAGGQFSSLLSHNTRIQPPVDQRRYNSNLVYYSGVAVNRRQSHANDQAGSKCNSGTNCARALPWPAEIVASLGLEQQPLLFCVMMQHEAARAAIQGQSGAQYSANRHGEALWWRSPTRPASSAAAQATNCAHRNRNWQSPEIQYLRTKQKRRPLQLLHAGTMSLKSGAKKLAALATQAITGQSGNSDRHLCNRLTRPTCAPLKDKHLKKVLKKIAYPGRDLSLFYILREISSHSGFEQQLKSLHAQMFLIDATNDNVLRGVSSSNYVQGKPKTNSKVEFASYAFNMLLQFRILLYKMTESSFHKNLANPTTISAHDRPVVISNIWTIIKAVTDNLPTNFTHSSLYIFEVYNLLLTLLLQLFALLYQLDIVYSNQMDLPLADIKLLINIHDEYMERYNRLIDFSNSNRICKLDSLDDIKSQLSTYYSSMNNCLEERMKLQVRTSNQTEKLLDGPNREHPHQLLHSTIKNEHETVGDHPANCGNKNTNSQKVNGIYPSSALKIPPYRTPPPLECSAEDMNANIGKINGNKQVLSATKSDMTESLIDFENDIGNKNHSYATLRNRSSQTDDSVLSVKGKSVKNRGSQSNSMTLLTETELSEINNINAEAKLDTKDNSGENEAEKASNSTKNVRKDELKKAIDNPDILTQEEWTKTLENTVLDYIFNESVSQEELKLVYEAYEKKRVPPTDDPLTNPVRNT
ncbi:MAG: hypothetical protein MHMPM18_001068 [Marteilia pararefringens]